MCRARRRMQAAAPENEVSQARLRRDHTETARRTPHGCLLAKCGCPREWPGAVERATGSAEVRRGKRANDSIPAFSSAYIVYEWHVRPRWATDTRVQRRGGQAGRLYGHLLLGPESGGDFARGGTLRSEGGRLVHGRLAVLAGCALGGARARCTVGGPTLFLRSRRAWKASSASTTSLRPANTARWSGVSPLTW